METKKTRDSKKVIAEKRKQYLALQYEIYKYEKNGQPAPKEIIEHGAAEKGDDQVHNRMHKISTGNSQPSGNQNNPC